MRRSKVTAARFGPKVTARSLANAFVGLERERRAGGLSLVDHLCGSEPPIDETLHYPDNDCQDPLTGAQYFLHRHGSEGLGVTTHLHLFKRWRTPEIEAAGLDGTITHLVAFELDATGAASHCFSVNQWVVGDYWLSASETVTLFEGWQFDLRGSRAEGAWAFWHRWVAGLVAYYLHGPVTESLHARDEALDRQLEQYPECNVLQDRSLEVFGRLGLPQPTLA
ncbi:DUF6969 family protein [Alcaligenes sp.]|uniref:DUF6969 family protein n=1 Tax=Alcaligenes sp. TaxID=512 RepID=UPI003CFD7784